MYYFSKLKLDPHILLSAIIASHLGWVFEMILFVCLYGGIADRGFVTLPLCPIYGITMLAVYYLIGTPHSGGVLIRGMARGGARNIVYFLLAVIIPSLAELIGGEVMEIVSGEVLWGYEHIGYNFGRYVSLPISLGWGALIFVVMTFYDNALNLLRRIPDNLARRLAISLSALVAIDFAGNLILSVI